MSVKVKLMQWVGTGVMELLRLGDRYLSGSQLGLAPAEVQIDPYPAFTALRGKGGLLRSYMNRGWMALRFEQVQAIFLDKRFGTDMRGNKFLVRVLRATAGDNKVIFLDQPSMLNLNAPDHTRLRKLAQQGFLHNAIAGLEPEISRIVDNCLDQAEPDKFDLIESLAKPMPAIVIANLLGLPEADLPEFQQWSNDLLGFAELDNPANMTKAAIANEKLVTYFEKVIDQKRLNPGQELIDQLIAAEEQGDKLTAEEMYSTCILLLLAGHETTTRLISNGMHLLLTHPEQLAKLRSDMSLLPNAIEEMLRFEPPVQFMPRHVREDLEFCGHKLKKHQMVMVGIASANRDESAIENADQFDIARKNIKHISFGYGIHLCLGMALARLEAKVAFTSLLNRYPDMKLAKQKLDWGTNPLVRGMKNLLVEV